MSESVLPQLAPRDLCTGCGACRSGCPKDAIRMERDAEGFLYPAVDERCVQCGHCTHICPVLKRREERSAPAVFAAWSEDEAVRQQSTAGGVFTLLAECVLESGGVVFGAAMDEQLRLLHTAVKRREELGRLRGSKPVQSDTGDAYRQVRLALGRGQCVLFSGTPCQVDGLYRYLGEYPENLITCDVLCRGVASPGVWEKLLRSIAYVKQKRPVDVSFCAKLPGGGGERRFRVTFADGSRYDAPIYKTEFGRGIRRGLFLRPACHRCPYLNTNRPGDLSLGLFRGLPKEFFPEEQKKGISLLLVNSVRGAHILDMLPLKKTPRPLEEAVSANAALQAPAVCPEDRRRFFEELAQRPFQQVRMRFLSALAHRERNPAAAIKAFLQEKPWKKH